MDDPTPTVGRRIRFIGRAMLPFGIIYLAVAVFYFGYYLASGEFGPFHAVYSILAALTSVFLIVQGWLFRHGSRFR